MFNVEHENALKSFIITGLCSDSELCSLESENVLKKFKTSGLWALDNFFLPTLSVPGFLLI